MMCLVEELAVVVEGAAAELVVVVAPGHRDQSNC
jgi:hypothetical protein